MTQVTFTLPSELVERAREAGLLSDERLIAMIEAELEAEDDAENDWEDTPDEEIEAGFLAGWDDVMKGKTIPADVALAKLRAELDDENR